MRSRVKAVAVLVPVALSLWALSTHWFVPQEVGDWIRVGAFVFLVLVGVSRQNKLLIDEGKALDAPSRLRKLALFMTAALVGILIVGSKNMDPSTTKTLVGWILIAAVVLLGGAWASLRLHVAAALPDEKVAELLRHEARKANG